MSNETEMQTPPPQTHVAAPQCCMCGKKGLSTVEGDGGSECELDDGRWVCSAECWDRAVEPPPSQHVLVDADEVSRAKCRLAQQLSRIPTKNISQHDRDVRTLIDACSSPAPQTREVGE